MVLSLSLVCTVEVEYDNACDVEPTFPASPSWLGIQLTIYGRQRV